MVLACDVVTNTKEAIRYYNTKRVQCNLSVVTPMEKYRMTFAV